MTLVNDEGNIPPADNLSPSLVEQTFSSFERVQKLLAQKIDRTHERIENTKKLVETFREREAQLGRTDQEIAGLRSEIAARQRQLVNSNTELIKVMEEAKEARMEARSFEIQLRQFEVGSAALRAQLAESHNARDRLNAELDLSRACIARLEGEKANVEAAAGNLSQRLVRMHDTATGEIGRVIKALLNPPKKSRWRGASMQEQAALLVKSGIVDPQRYLACNKDVAEAGMDPAEHYILHGASEGRDPTGALRDILADP